MTNRLSNKGFTLVEVLVVAPVMILTIVIMMSFLFNQYGLLTQEGTRLRLVTDAQLITLNLQDDVFFASVFGSTKNSNLVDSYEPSGGWLYSTTPQTLILSGAALTKSNRDPTREPVYIDTLGCEPENKEQNDVLQNNIIVFAQGTELYKRTLTAPSSLSLCGSSFDKQTCPAEHVTASCSKDVLLTDKLDSFTVTYYDEGNVVVTTPEQAQRIKVSVRLKDRAYAEDVFGDANITLKKLN